MRMHNDHPNETARFHALRTQEALARYVRVEGHFAEVTIGMEADRIGGGVIALGAGPDDSVIVAVQFDVGRDICATWRVPPRHKHASERITDSIVCFESGTYWTRSGEYTADTRAIRAAIA